MSEYTDQLDLLVELNYLDKVPVNFLFSFGYHADELTIVLKAHLFAEFLIDHIIKEKFSRPKRILNYTFYKKLEIIYSIDLIPNYLYKNILFLNKMRNKYSHDLDYRINPKEIVLFKTDNKRIVFRDEFKKKSNRQIVKLFCFAVLAQFNDYIYLSLNLNPTFRNNGE